MENIHLKRGQLLMQQSRFEMAEEHLRMAIAADTGDATAHAMLALCLCARKEYQGATEEARQSIHAAPDEAIGFYAMASVMFHRNRLKAAYSAITDAIRIEPWDADHFGMLASIEFARSRWDECLNAAEQGLEFEPEDVDCINLRAMSLVKLGRRDEAESTIETALANEPDNAETHANLGWTLLHSGKPRKSMEHFREALRLEPGLEWARLGIIEAMKARNPIYRWILAWFLWMGRLSPRVQIALILGLVFGQGILQSICESVPMLAPFQMPIAVVYTLFVWMTWVAPTLFNLVLFLDRFGRLVLNTTEKVAAGLMGMCIIALLAIGSFGQFVDHDLASFYWMAGLLFLGLTIPVTTSLQLEGRRRYIMVLYSIGLLIVILITLGKLADASSICAKLPDKINEIDDRLLLAALKARLEIFGQWVLYGVNGVVLSTWLGLGIHVVPNRK